MTDTEVITNLLVYGGALVIAVWIVVPLVIFVIEFRRDR